MVKGLQHFQLLLKQCCHFAITLDTILFTCLDCDRHIGFFVPCLIHLAKLPAAQWLSPLIDLEDIVYFSQTSEGIEVGDPGGLP